jgi:DNA-binding NarL/FixJ family response regulator
VARVLIADDNDAVRGGLRTLLGLERRLEVVGEAVDGEEALLLCSDLRPDLVLMDLGMPRLDGLAATRAIKQAWPCIRVLLFTMSDSPSLAADAHEAGASGFLLKGATRRELMTAVRRALTLPT